MRIHFSVAHFVSAMSLLYILQSKWWQPTCSILLANCCSWSDTHKRSCCVPPYMKSKLLPIWFDNFGHADSNPCMLACTVTKWIKWTCVNRFACSNHADKLMQPAILSVFSIIVWVSSCEYTTFRVYKCVSYYARICGPVSMRYRSSETNYQYGYNHRCICIGWMIARAMPFGV